MRWETYRECLHHGIDNMDYRLDVVAALIPTVMRHFLAARLAWIDGVVKFPVGTAVAAEKTVVVVVWKSSVVVPAPGDASPGPWPDKST
jgi:hypothetical protein